MTISNALSNTGVETPSKAWDGWGGSQPTLISSFPPLCIASTMIHPQNTSIPKCTLRTGGGRHRDGEILENNKVIMNFNRLSGRWIHWFRWTSCLTEQISQIMLLTEQSGLYYIWQLAIYLRRSARCPKHTFSERLHSCQISSRTAIVPRSGWVNSGKQTERCWTGYSGGYTNLSPLNTIPAPKVRTTIFSLQMAASGIANCILWHGLEIGHSIVTYIISNDMSVFGVPVQSTNLELMSLLANNTLAGSQPT